MSGAVLVVLVALGVALFLSLVLWALSWLPRRPPRTFLEELGAVSARSGNRVEPSSGIAHRMPIASTPVTEAPASAEPAESPESPESPEERGHTPDVGDHPQRPAVGDTSAAVGDPR